MTISNTEQKVKAVLKNHLTLDEALDQLLASLDQEELVLLQQRLLKSQLQIRFSDSETAFTKALSAKQFDAHDRLKLEFANLYEFFQHRKKLLDNSLTASEVAKLLNSTRQTPHDRRKGGTLLGILDNGIWKFPTWQFDAGSPNGVIDGLPEVLKTLKLSDFSKVNWLVKPNPVLGGLAPVDALKRGMKQEVITEANGVGVI